MEDPTEPRLDEKTANRHEEKEEAILEACRQRDLAALRALAESPGGLVSDSLRQLAWPILLGLPPSDSEAETDLDASAWKDLPRHRDEDQVQLDVNRAFIYYPNCQSESQLAAQKAELTALILQVLRRHPYLCYFQGYHDIAQVLLLVLPPTAVRSQALTRLSLLRIRDFMLPSLSPALAQLRLIPDILRLADPPLWHHLSQTAPFFALAGTLTMYAHDVTTLGAIARLFDALLAAAPDPALSVYLFAAAVRARRADLFATPRDDPDVLHCILAKLPAQPLDWEALIPEARELLGRFPPERLPAWRRISRWSVLKTARRSGLGEEGQSVEMGREWFGRQAAELRWQEKKERARKWLWRHRRPAGAVGVAVLVAVLAVLLRRGPLPGPLASGAAYVSGLLARWWR